MGFYIYLLVAFLVGLLIGWFIWGRLRGELDGLRSEMDRTRSDRDKFRTDATRLTGEIDACASARADLERRLREAQAAPKSGTASGTASAASQAPAAMISSPASAAKPASSAKSASAAKPAAAKKPAAGKAVSTPKISAAPKAAPKASPAPKAAASGTGASRSGAPKSGTSKTGTSKAAAPKATAAKAAAPKKAAASGKAAAGKGADNLRRLIGIGPVNERKLHGLGVKTFADIAAWKAADIKRVEDALAFDGRIEREKWIEQAKLLAAGNEKEFARRFPSAGTASNT